MISLQQFLVNEVNKNNTQAETCLQKIKEDTAYGIQWYTESLYKSQFMNDLINEVSDNLLRGKSEEECVNEALEKATNQLTKGQTITTSSSLMVMVISLWQNQCFQEFHRLMTWAEYFIQYETSNKKQK